jgi:hypothetical protein
VANDGQRIMPGRVFDQPEPGEAGTLTVLGEYRQSGAGLLAITVTPRGTSRLDLSQAGGGSGRAYLDPGSEVMFRHPPAGRTAAAEGVLFLSTADGLRGKFDKIIGRGRVSYDANNGYFNYG